MGQLHRTDAGRLDRLRNIRIDVLEFRVGEVNIHAAQNIDARRHRLPVEGSVVGDVQIQILVQGADRLLRPPDGIGRVDLAVAAVRKGKIAVAEDAAHPDLPVLAVDADDDDDIGIVSSSHGRVSGVHTEGGYVPVSLHLLDLFRGKDRVLDF